MSSQPSYLGVATAGWVAALKSSDSLVRRLAAHALAEIGRMAREAPGRLAATTFGAPITAIQRKLPQDRASASDSGTYIRAYQSLLFTANRHDHAYRCRRSDRVLLVLHGHLHIGPPPILAQKHAPSCG
jgi:hypothetical protein